jgi:hypothetical protein
VTCPVTPVSIGYAVGHGRIVRVGQVWRSNDRRRLKAVRILGIDHAAQIVLASNVLTCHVSEIALRNFTIGSRGWSLDTAAP